MFSYLPPDARVLSTTHAVVGSLMSPAVAQDKLSSNETCLVADPKRWEPLLDFLKILFFKFSTIRIMYVWVLILIGQQNLPSLQ